MAWLVGATTASAQLPMPGLNLPSNDNSGAAAAAVPSYAQAAQSMTTAAAVPNRSTVGGKQLVDQTRMAIAAKQFEAAVNLYRSAAAASKTDPTIASDVAKLRVDLQIAGIDAELLSMPAPTALPKATGFNATPLAAVAPSGANSVPGANSAGSEPCAGIEQRDHGEA